LDAITLLTEEHQKAKALFEQIEAETDPTTKQQLTLQVIADLRSHTKIEEEVLYPLLREQVKGGGKLFEESMQEHEEAKKAMKKLEGMTPDDADWQPTFEILMHGVLHHATEEESEMFPKMRETWSDQKLTELGEQLAADKSGELKVDLSVDELMEQAQAADIEGRSSMNKGELETALGHH
jgi:hemerythrin superfamily protein